VSLPGCRRDRSRPQDLPVVLEGEALPIVALVHLRSAPERLGPENPLVRRGNVNPRFLPGDVAVHEHELFQATHVVGMGVGNQYVLDIKNRQTRRAECPATGIATIDQEMVLTFDDQKIGLVVASGEGTPAPQKIDPQLTFILQCQRAVKNLHIT